MAVIRQQQPAWRNRQAAWTGRNVMTMADIWLTAAAEAAFSTLQAAAPAQAEAVSDAINDITVSAGQRIDLPGAPPGEPFLAKEPRDPEAPAVIYRHATIEEQGEWLVVSLMGRDDYNAARRAERELATYPPTVQQFVRSVVGTVANTVSTANVAAHSGTVTVTQPGAVPTNTTKA
jgi:hypothetical protein